jgi:hypothetical protein
MDYPDEVNPELQSEYRGIVGSLMYLYQWTRPDLGFAVTFLSRYLHKPGDKHLQAAKHVLCYLKERLNSEFSIREIWHNSRHVGKNLMYYMDCQIVILQGARIHLVLLRAI